ncbi:MAG TPA: hypothetical protein VJ746_04895 [Nitrospira sp.]|nr:hypothetical protein [Nitrospira sp.]
MRTARVSLAQQLRVLDAAGWRGRYDDDIAEYQSPWEWVIGTNLLEKWKPAG